MVIAQVGFYIPLEIQSGLLNGDLIRYGGIVRDTAGQIVAHLKEVQLPAAGEVEVDHLAEILKRPKVIAAAAVGVAAAGVTALVVARKKGWGGKESLLRKSFNASLGSYLEAIREQRLDLGAIDKLITDFDAIGDFSDGNGGIVIRLDLKQGEVLLGIVSDYTRELAEANAVNLDEILDREPGSERNIVIDLRRYLEAQRKIFTDAA